MKDPDAIPDSAVVYGILVRNGIETRCQVSLPAGASVPHAPAVYSHCTVVETEERLPEGIYELKFLDQNAFVRLHGGVWSTGRPWRNRSIPSPELSFQAA